MVFKHEKIIALITIPLLLLSCITTNDDLDKRNIPVELRNGDIAFRRGTGTASQAVLYANTRGAYSHVGVVVNINSAWYVVHEVPYEGKTLEDDKIHSEPIESFFRPSDSSAGAIYRLESLDSLSQQKVRDYVLYQYGRNIPFDHDYDLSDSSKMYCSEFVWRSYLEVDIDITKGSRTDLTIPMFRGIKIFPSDIEYNEDLEPIYRF
ncbi:MAG: YiiX/YebB-like N1pC/P60 family cysteine hydrolase [Rikenellaceae bacterium]